MKYYYTENQMRKDWRRHIEINGYESFDKYRRDQEMMLLILKGQKV